MKFVYCADEIASIVINFSPEGLMALMAHTFFCEPSLASGKNSLRDTRCIRIRLRGIPGAVAVSNLFSSKKRKKLSDFASLSV